MIELFDIKKSFGAQQVLQGISLTIPKGKTTVVLGRSGCGKSDLLKVILRLLSLDEGKIVIGGVDTSNFSESEMMPIRRKIGMLFQGAALFDSMTVKENVAFGLRMHTRMSEEEISERVRVCLEEVGLAGSEETMPVELSGGMRKRAALARAIAMSPDF
ncbi:ABC transporter ATP-binding protein, partial [bacterium]